MNIENTTPETTVEVIQEPKETAEGAEVIPMPDHKKPLTRPLFTKKQHEQIVRSMTAPAMAAKTQFRENRGNKNNEGKHIQQPIHHPPRKEKPMVAEVQTGSNTIPQVPQKTELSKADVTELSPLKAAGFVVGTVAVMGIIVVGIDLAARALAKKFGLEPKITMIQG